MIGLGEGEEQGQSVEFCSNVCGWCICLLRRCAGTGLAPYTGDCLRDDLARFSNDVHISLRNFRPRGAKRVRHLQASFEMNESALRTSLDVYRSKCGWMFFLGASAWSAFLANEK